MLPRMPITRRDFLNGTALTVAAGLTPAAQLAAQPRRYPPALMGCAASMPVRSRPRMRSRAKAGALISTTCPIDESYDLVVVGGGHQRACRRRGFTAARSPRRAS